MENIKYRPAITKDLPTLLKFEQGIIAYERQYDSTLKPDPISYYNLETLISSNKSIVFVAEHNNKLVGSGYAKIVQSKLYNTHNKHVYLGFMYVEPKYRGQGIIKNIISALNNWAKSNNIFEARLEVYHNNDSAVKAYKKNGFTGNLLEMRITIN